MVMMRIPRDRYSRVCTKCEERKLLVEFTVTARDGRLARCKSCCLETQKEWRRENPGKASATRKRAFDAWRIKYPKLPPREPITSQNGRLCRSCDTRKSIEFFKFDKRSSDGLTWRCAECMRADHRRWGDHNRDHVRDMARGSAKKARMINPGKIRENLRRSRLRTKYGIELEDLIALTDTQGGKCRICAKVLQLYAPDRRKGNVACVDHDHDTGQIRGILCSHCNRGLGLFMDSRPFIESAALYLKENGK